MINTQTDKQTDTHTDTQTYDLTLCTKNPDLYISLVYAVPYLQQLYNMNNPCDSKIFVFFFNIILNQPMPNSAPSVPRIQSNRSIHVLLDLMFRSNTPVMVLLTLDKYVQ